VRIATVHVDGLDSTDTILRLMSRRRPDIIFLSGASFAGFNVVDCRGIYSILHIPIIAVSREKPNNASVRLALRKHFRDWKTRWRLVRDLGRIHPFASRVSEQPLYFEAVGISQKNAKTVICSFCTTSRVPEPIRVAGIVAKGLALVGKDLSFY
jgi:endonuclease V-like protein UPF0215 family